jgi:segregation and condensation protein A
MFLKLENRVHAIVTFLALLELLNMQEIELTQGEGLNNFWLTPGVKEEENKAADEVVVEENEES